MNATIERNFQDPAGRAGDMRASLLAAGVRRRCKDLAVFIDKELPAEAGREKATAITHIETAMFWACAGLVRNAAVVGEKVLTADGADSTGASRTGNKEEGSAGGGK